MDSAPVQAIHDEAQHAFETTDRPYQGLLIFLALADKGVFDISPATRAALQTQADAYKLRLNRLTAVIERSTSLTGSITQLFENGYPTDPSSDIPADELQELTALSQEILAALATFHAQAITSVVTGEVGPERPTP